MKLYCLIIVLVLLEIPATSQTVANAKWKATLFLPDAVEVDFTFKKDTLYMTAKTSDNVVTNFFIQRNDTLMMIALPDQGSIAR